VPGRGGNEEGTPQAGATFDTMAHDACIACSAIAVRAARRGGAFFAASFLIVLVFLTVFLRHAVLLTVVFLRFVGSSFCRHGSLPDAHCIWKVFVRSLPNKKVSQQARTPSSAIAAATESRNRHSNVRNPAA
jgi:hypothetical protein